MLTIYVVFHDIRENTKKSIDLLPKESETDISEWSM